MLEAENDKGDINQTAVTAVKESDGEVRRMTLDDDDNLRVMAALFMDTLLTPTSSRACAASR